MLGLQRLIKYWISPYGAYGVVYGKCIIIRLFAKQCDRDRQSRIKWEKYVCMCLGVGDVKRKRARYGGTRVGQVILIKT